jgi:hypothetical protein
MVLPFGWSQFEAANWAVFPHYLLKIGFVDHLITYLLNLLTMKELKPNRCCFYLSPTCFCHGIRYWLRQR